jgi:diacylglycerol kinase (ATP)
VRVATLHNPRSGRGRGAEVAALFQEAVSRAGHSVRALDVTCTGDDAGELIEWSEAVVVVGGDGTLHHSLPGLLRHRRPLFHAAVGTENLFAREFGHGRSPKVFLRALDAGATRPIDVATLSVGDGPPTPFVIMASLGPDASIVHRLSARRSGPISHLSYLRPALKELVSPRIPTLSIRVDGKELVRGRVGLVLIANMRQYAVGLNPAKRADPSDGQLDVVFLPGRSLGVVALGVLAWRLGIAAGSQSARGRQVDVEMEDGGECLPQADGEAVVPVPVEGNPGVIRGPVRLLAALRFPAALDVFVV